MGGNKSGGLKAAESNKRLYGDDWYKVIGSKGGKASGKGGFAGQPDVARAMGAVGGRLSSRSRKSPAVVAKIKKDKAFQAAYANLIKVQEKAREARKARDEQA